MVLSIARRPARPFARSALAPACRHAAASLLRARLSRFLLVGSLGFTVDAVAFGVLSSLGAPDFSARALSLALATSVTWRLNRRFTFTASGRAAHAEAMRYATVAACVQGANYGLFLGLRALLPSMPALAALAVSAGAAAGLSFAGQALVTFGTRLWPAPLPAPSGART